MKIQTLHAAMSVMQRVLRFSSFSSFGIRRFSSNNANLLETLRVIPSERDVFIQSAESLFIYPHRRSVFGGQIIGSAIYAAQKTLTKNFPLHSIHAYFLTAADNSSDISYTIQRLRDGKSFESRSVTARQDNRIILECEMSFHRQEQGPMDHQMTMPTQGLIDTEDREEHRSMDLFRSCSTGEARIHP